MLMTDARETCTRNSRARVNLREKLVRVSYRLAARFFSCEFLASNKTCSIWCEKLAITWLDLRTRTSKIWCKFLVRVFGASFSYKFLVRLSRALDTIHMPLFSNAALLLSFRNTCVLLWWTLLTSVWVMTSLAPTLPGVMTSAGNSVVCDSWHLYVQPVA